MFSMEFPIYIGVIGGLGIFLYGIYLMGESLKGIAGSKLRLIIEKATSKVWIGILVGAALTALIQSSSSFTAIVVALISAGLMGLPQAIPLIMGSNIGTTITAVIIGADFGIDIGKFSLLFVFIGAFLIFFFKRKKMQSIGGAFVGFGLLFFGLELMGGGLSEVFQKDQITNILTNIGDGVGSSFVGVVTGTILTAIIQSSSAFIGIVQKIFALKDASGNLLNIITPITAIGLVLGSNIGTTITAVLSSFSGSRDAKRAALANVLIKTIGVITFLIIFLPFNKQINSLFDKLYNISYFANKPEAIIALIHVSFNVLMTLSLCWFVKLLVKIVTKIIPLTPSEKMINSVDNLQPNLIKKAPALALDNVKGVIVDMGNIVNKMFVLTKNYMNSNNNKESNEVILLEDVVDNYDNKIHDFLAKLSMGELSDKMIKEQAIYFDTIRDLERIGDHTINLIEFMTERYDQHLEFSSEMLGMLNHMLDLLTNMIDDSLQAFKCNDKKAAARIRATEPQIDELEKKYRREEIDILTRGAKDVLNNDLHFVDILANLERIGDHTNNIADNILFNSVHDIKINIEKS